MTFKKIGTNFKLDTKNRNILLKIAIALILSNVFFYLLFSPNDIEEKVINENEVEIHLQAIFHTPFQKGKKVLLIHKRTQRMVEARLLDWVNEENQTLSVSVENSQAQSVIDIKGWEIVPHMKRYEFAQVVKGELYEIRY